jgi:hypothetical protein
MTNEMKQTIIDIAERFGVPVVILAAVLWMTREAATSVHSTVIVPMIESHTQFLEATSQTLHELGKTQDQQAETLREIAVSQRDIQHELMKQRQ